MWKTKQIDAPAGFNFRLTALSHGWYDLLPFSFDEANSVLRYVFFDNQKNRAVNAEISGAQNAVSIRLDTAVSDSSPIVAQVKHILRFDEPIEQFHNSIAAHERLGWVAKNGVGRLLRSPMVFEDLVKTLCTTNCSWGLTRNMVTNLVAELGVAAKGDVRAFPTPEALASRDEKFYRDVVRAGYRSPFFVEMAEAVAAGKINPESWMDPGLPSMELRKQIKSIKGFGEYAADNLMKLLGRYDGLALDSWLRAQFYKKHNRGKVCPDKKIEKMYSGFGEWKGLAIWCDMTEDWHPQV